MSDSKDSNKKSELLVKLDELLETVGDKYGPFMIEELYSRMEKTINEFNEELNSIFESTFEQSKKINKVVSEAMSSGDSPDLSGLNINNNDVPNFITNKKEIEKPNNKTASKEKTSSKKRSFFSRKKKK